MLNALWEVNVAAKKAAKKAKKKPTTKAASAPARRGRAAVKKPAHKAKAPDRLHRKRVHPELDDTAPKDETWEIFQTFDTDGSGAIDRAELAHLLEALGSAPTEDELLVAFDVVDANHSGKISWEEFSAWWRSR